jgi:thiamine-phosphate pyrophosphorylase
LNKLEDIDFYLVTDSSLSKNGIFSDVENALKAGCRIVQYREKKKDTKTMINEAMQIKKICNNKALFLIDDRADVALAVNADGIHIGQDDIPYESARKLLGENKIIGLTVHNVDEAIEAEKLGVEYVGVAPIFDTDTKNDIKTPCGIEMIKKIRNEVKVPIVAVGGITKNNVKEVIDSGADSIVSIKPVISSDDVYSEVFDFINIIRGGKSK